MYFIGDVHGLFVDYGEIIKDLPESVQLGDMGLGFTKKIDARFPTGTDHVFIRGNHDNPEACRSMPNYLGDFGTFGFDMFFISGGYSIDWRMRTMGVDIWLDEELRASQFFAAGKEYEEAAPRVMFTHECPGNVMHEVGTVDLGESSTARSLKALFEIHKPELWVFAHHHHNKEFDYKGTHFVCVDELCVYDSDKGGFL